MNYLEILVVVMSAIMSMLSVNWVYFKILRIAKEKNLVDNPDARKLQKNPIPVVGGIAVFFGVISGILTGVVMAAIFDVLLPLQLMPIVCAMIVMLYIGGMDDMVGLTPGSRFLIEILTVLGIIYAGGVCVDNFYGMWGIYEISWWVAVPITVFAGVGIINAINMVDGVNGLSSGLCIVCSCFYGIAFIWLEDIANAMLAFTMAAALIPFMVHNVFGKNSRMFIGDAGTMVLGVLMTWFTISTIQSGISAKMDVIHEGTNMIALALAILSVPVFDTVRVMTMRVAKKKSPFHPDKTHLHHVFISLGVSHLLTSSIEIGLNTLIIAIWALCTKIGLNMDWQLYVVVLSSMLFVWGAYAVIRWNGQHHTVLFHKLTHVSLASSQKERGWLTKFEKWLDAPEDRYMERVQQVIATPQPKLREFDLSDPENKKEQDRKRIYDFMKGKVEVHVIDIKRYSGADALRVYPILFEEELSGYVRVIQRDSLGAPIIVSLIEQ